MTQDLGQCPTNTVVSMGRRNTRPKPPCRASIAKSRSRTLIQNGTPSWPGPDCVRANTAVLHGEVLTEQAQRGEHAEQEQKDAAAGGSNRDRKSTRLNSSHPSISYAVFCLKKK